MKLLNFATIIFVITILGLGVVTVVNVVTEIWGMG